MVEAQISDLRLMNDLIQQEGFELAKLKNINCFNFSQPKHEIIIEINQVQEASESGASKK